VKSGRQTCSRPPCYRGELSGQGGNWVDGTASQGTGSDFMDEIHQLANVIVDYPVED